MLSSSRLLSSSLRYRRPYWMLHLKGADNWRIYEELQKDSTHQRIEMEYQAWLGGLDRPYVRPRCMTTHPLWLEKKRHLLKKSELQGPETPLERYVLEWEQKFFSFRGTLRPTPDDLHSAFDLVERPLDLSYAIQILNWCRNENDIHFAPESFQIFVEACLRVDRKDVALYALENADKLGFWFVDKKVSDFLLEKGPDFRAAPTTTTKDSTSYSATSTSTKTQELDEEALLAAELAALEEEERKLAEELEAEAKNSKKK
jgi:hypothetical protein